MQLTNLYAFYFIYRVIIIKVSKCYKKRSTDQNDAKFERNIIEDRGKRMASEKKIIPNFCNRWHCKHPNSKGFDYK